MKNVVRALICISISLVALNCTNDESMPAQGKVQFALAVTSSSADGGRILSQSFPAGSYISLSIETASGASVYQLKKVDLIKLGDGYLTAPLLLTEGSYRLTDLFVMSGDDEVLYATPKEGSPLAGLVTDPLPMNFSVTPNGVVNLNVQVVDANQQSPEGFGYVSFAVEVVGSDFSVSLFVGENNLSLTSGKLQLYQGNDLIYTQSLLAKVNPVNFKGDPDATYELVVQKEGYSIFHREYVLHELIEELDGKPLPIYIVPALTFTVIDQYSSPLVPLLIFIYGSNADLTIDWGDGTSQHGFGLGSVDLLHSYENSGKRYYININGGIDGILVVGCNNQLPVDVEKIDVTSLARLESFQMYNTRDGAPKHIDFSKNSNLVGLTFQASYIEELDISNNDLLTIVNITATHLSEENVSEIISDLHDNGVTNNTFGALAFFKESPPSSTTEPLVSLSAESRLKLIDLRDNYNWSIYPTNF